MDDIAERMRAAAAAFTTKLPVTSVTLKEAADEIEKLRAALKPFAALTSSEDYIRTAPDHGWCAAQSYRVGDYRAARAALSLPNAQQNEKAD